MTPPPQARGSLLDRTVNARDATLVLIAAEGSKTEEQYVDCLKQTGQIDTSRVQVTVLSTPDTGESAPDHVLTRLREIRHEFELIEEDELWLVIDVDRWGAPKLARVCKEATQAGVELAVSNPCFEVWLLLHTEAEIPVGECAAAEARLRDTLGTYNKSRLWCERYAPDRVTRAIERSRADDDGSARWPAMAGHTHVHRLVGHLLEQWPGDRAQ